MLTRLNGNLPPVLAAITTVCCLVATVILAALGDLSHDTAAALIGGAIAGHSVGQATKG